MFNFIYHQKTCLILLFLFPVAIKPAYRDYFVIWNVGQGQWTSWVKSSKCEHYDVGGEKYPNALDFHCHNKDHFWWISHWDYDHYKYLNKIKRKFMAKKLNKNNVETIYAPKHYKKKNDNSHIITIEHLLISGDSTRRAEKIWSKMLNKKIHILILGHHGSNTSTGTELLETISKNLYQSICSARKKKYGHPHIKVKSRLKKYKIPLICSENWGHIALYIR